MSQPFQFGFPSSSAQPIFSPGCCAVHFAYRQLTYNFVAPAPATTTAPEPDQRLHRLSRRLQRLLTEPHTATPAAVSAAVEIGTIRGVTIVDNNGALEKGEGPTPVPDGVVRSRSLESVAQSKPALNDLMADAHRRNFDAVLVWKIDRFGRAIAGLPKLSGRLLLFPRFSMRCSQGNCLVGRTGQRLLSCVGSGDIAGLRAAAWLLSGLGFW